MRNSRVSVCAVVLAAGLFGTAAVAQSDRRVDVPAEVRSSVSVASATPTVTTPAAKTPAEEPMSFSAAVWREDQLGGISPKVFELALHAASRAVTNGDIADPVTLTVIDFSKPSTTPRMWVFDLRSRTLLFEELVSHGRGSGRTMATAFSNLPESNQSSLGLYRTGETYIGKHGYSLRLDGLEAGVNDRARERAIVMHGAEYVNGTTAQAQGYLGRSLGCPALRPEISRQVIDAVKGGGLLFAYYPDAHWLQTSQYLDHGVDIG